MFSFRWLRISKEAKYTIYCFFQYIRISWMNIKREMIFMDEDVNNDNISLFSLWPCSLAFIIYLHLKIPEWCRIRDTCVVWHSPRALCNKSLWLVELRNMCTIQREKDWKMIWFIHIFSMCCCTDKQTQIEKKRIFFSSNFIPFYTFQCNNQRNIKAGSEYPTPTKFVLQRQNFFSLPFVIKPNIFYYQRQNELC